MSEVKELVVTKMVEKIFSAVEVIIDPYGLKEGQKNLTKSIFDNLAQDDELTIEEKMAVAQEYRFLLKKNKNRKRIINEAQKYVEETANPAEVDDSWIVNFWEKSGTVSDDKLQDLWSRILAAEVNFPRTVSKRLLHNLSLMSAVDAQNFMNLARFCFQDKYNNISHPIIYIKDNSIVYKNSRITTEVLNELEQFSLIQTNYESGFAFKRKKVLLYRNSLIELSGENIPVGNVRLTEDGQKLLSIIERSENAQILEYTIERLQYSGCLINITPRTHVFPN